MMASMELNPQMTLAELLQGIIELPVEMDQAINKPCLDSRKIEEGDLFLGCAGHTVHGYEYIDTAIEAGAHAVLWETRPDIDTLPFSWRTSPLGLQVPLIAIPDLSSKVGVIADRFYGQASRQMFVTGITGTNGKTSCSQFLAQILAEEHYCGIIGTLGNGLYGKLDSSMHTTPDAVSCHAFMAEMLKLGASDIVMEVSSHALQQGRVNAVQFDCAVFTNLSREHLDYHGDMQNYAKAKSRLFDVSDLKFAIINTDDEYGRELAKKVSPPTRLIRYGLSGEHEAMDVFASDIKLSLEGVQFHVTTPWGEGDVAAGIMGQFNVSNLLAVLSVLLVHGMALDEVLEKLAHVNAVPGRMECLHQQNKPVVVIDYAHSPDALEQVLLALREHLTGQLWCVFGCGGDRDKGKRPLMGEIADRLADVIVLTNDNPRSESPGDILNDIQTGLTGQSECHVIEDRARAIAHAISNAHINDIVLIAGKGHEDYQLVGDKRLTFSDLAEARKHMGLVA